VPDLVSSTVRTVQYSTVQYSTVQTVQYRQYSTDSTVRYSTLQCGKNIALQCTTINLRNKEVQRRVLLHIRVESDPIAITVADCTPPEPLLAACLTTLQTGFLICSCNITPHPMNVDASTAFVMPLLASMLLCRCIVNVMSKWIDAEWVQKAAADGRVRSTWQQASTATGRLSSCSPNLQAGGHTGLYCQHSAAIKIPHPACKGYVLLCFVYVCLCLLLHGL
jgi:hypothetical protein